MSGSAPPPFLDMTGLIGRLDGWLAEHSARLREQQLGPFERAAFARRTGFAPRGRGQPEIVVGADVALELGHPQTASQSFLLLTCRPGVVVHGRVRWVGPDLPELASPGRHPYAQILIVQLRQGSSPDPFALDAAQFLTHRLPGYMVRSVPGRLWVRVSRRARAQQLGLATVGQALVSAYADDFPEVEAAEVVFATESASTVDALGPLGAEARVLAGQHRKLALVGDGELECRDLDCERCDERPVCDALRDVVVRRRRQTAAAGGGR